MTKKEIFNYLVDKKIYLNYYLLNKVHSKVKNATCFMAVDKLIVEFDLAKYSNKEAKSKAAYQLDKSILNKHKKAVSIPVYKLDMETGKIVEKYTSIYQAAKSVGTKGYGDIARVCRGTLNYAYGFKWRFA